MNDVIEYRDKLDALLSDTLLLADEREKALHYFDQALMEVSRYVLNRELEELRELAYEKTDLDEEVGLDV
jgi:hypothetical protein